MERSLMSDYGMTERGAQIFMGQVGEDEIANVVDPAFTVVAKIRAFYDRPFFRSQRNGIR